MKNKSLLSVLFLMALLTSALTNVSAQETPQPTEDSMIWCQEQRISENALALTREQLVAFFPGAEVQTYIYEDADQGCVYVFRNDQYVYFPYSQDADGSIRVAPSAISSAVSNITLLQIGALGSGSSLYAGPAGFCIQNGVPQHPTSCYAGGWDMIFENGNFQIWIIYWIDPMNPNGGECTNQNRCYIGFMLRWTQENGQPELEIGVANYPGV